MPLLKTSNTDLVRIDLPAEGEWVKVKAALGRDDEREIARRVQSAARLNPVTFEAESVDAGALLDTAKFAALEVSIRAWSFREPVTAANLRALDDASVDCIVARLNELYPPKLTDDEKNA